VLVMKGTPAVGVVTHAKKARAFGKPGKLEITITSTTAVDGQTVQLTSTKEHRGKKGFLHGRDIEIEQGTPFTAFVNQAASVKLKSQENTDQ
jgi:hypothetical protein